MTDLAKRGPIELIAIINAFNRKALLQQALGSLSNALRNARFGSAIIVFEAGSCDGSAEFLDDWRERNPGDNLFIVRPTNGLSSFSDGVNTACAAALAQFPECRWLFLYETDNWLASVEPIDQAILLLQSQPELAGVGFTVKRHDGTFGGYGMSFPSYTSLALGLNLSHLLQLDPPNDSPWQATGDLSWRTCDIVFTSPLLIRRAAWQQTGGLDAGAFPFSDTDVDWAWRCARCGWKMAVIASDAVVHDNLEQASAWSATRVVQFHRSRLRLLKRHRGKGAALLKPFLFVRHGLETILLACRCGSDPRTKAKLANRKELLRTVWTDYS